MNKSKREIIFNMVKESRSPAYIYGLSELRRRALLFKKGIPPNGHVHFAMKANHHTSILAEFKKLGFGLDVVSGGEIRLALERGFTGQQLIFSGVGKTVAEIECAIQNQVAQINIESGPEIVRVAEIASRMKKKVNIAFRMNPDVDVNTHPYICTGFRDNKFGLDFSEVPYLIDLVKSHKESLILRGLALHIGSQIRDIVPFQESIQKTCVLFDSLRRQGHELTSLDVGGGLGIDYGAGEDKSSCAQDESLLQAYFAAVTAVTSEHKISEICFEPGRFLVAPTGILVGEVQYIKKTPFKNFVILDTGMHHLIRPALYQAAHRIVPITVEGQVDFDESLAKMLCDVVGPICESSDVLGYARTLPSSLKQGDLVGILDAGAYGAVMASDYNLHQRPIELTTELF